MSHPIRTEVTDKSISNLTTAAQTIMAKNNARNFIFIQNISDVSVWINLAGTAAANTAGSFELKSTSSFTMEGNVCVTAAISIIAESGSGKSVTAYEG